MEGKTPHRALPTQPCAPGAGEGWSSQHPHDTGPKEQSGALINKFAHYWAIFIHFLFAESSPDFPQPSGRMAANCLLLLATTKNVPGLFGAAAPKAPTHSIALVVTP